MLVKEKTHISNFKEDIKDWFDKNNSDVSGLCNKNDFLQFIFDYDNLSLSKDDFSKRKRIKNTIPLQIQCIACRANGEQCTRRKKDDNDYCGTHLKGTPYGIIESNKPVITHKKCQVWTQEINGIHYFIDNNNNIYLHKDIIDNKINPSIIGKCMVDDTGTYNICGNFY